MAPWSGLSHRKARDRLSIGDLALEPARDCPSKPATLDDLYRVEGKAELVSGKIIHYVASGDVPSEVAFEIAVRLAHIREADAALARHYPDGLGYAMIPPLSSGRESFQPDASYYTGPLAKESHAICRRCAGIRRRSPRAKAIMAPRRKSKWPRNETDYFEAGTLIVWDVDPVAATIASYSAICRKSRPSFTAAKRPTLSPRCRDGG